MPTHVVPRAELQRRLRDVTAPVVVLVAGPGWGKTTALAGVATTRRTAWLTLTSRHAALVELLPALVGALAAAELPVPPTVAALADQATGPQVGDGQVAERIAAELVAHLSPDSGDLLVLDEVDSVPSDTPGLQLLDALLRRLPDGLLVAMAARESVPVDLAGLRARAGRWRSSMPPHCASHPLRPRWSWPTSSGRPSWGWGRTRTRSR